MRHERTVRHTVLGLAIVGTCAVSAAANADNSDQREALARCNAITSPSDRLACYDSLAVHSAAPASPPPAANPAPAATAAPPAVRPVQAPVTPPTPPPTAVAAAAPAAPVPAASADDFGLTPVQKAPRGPETIHSITARIQGFGKAPTGRTRVALDNGQTWELEDDVDALLAPGDSITIKRAFLGSFLMTTPKNFSHRVRRIS